MNSKSFSFSMDAQAFQAWKRTVPRDQPLHDAIPEDLARAALERDNNDLTDEHRQACRMLLEQEAINEPDS